MEYYWTMKKNKIMPFATTCMDLEFIILSEISQKKRQMPYDFAYMWNLKKYDINDIYKIETDLQTSKINLFGGSLVAKSFLTLVTPWTPSSSVHGISQARIIEWVDIFFSRGSSQPRDQTQVSRIADGEILYQLHHQGSPNLWLPKGNRRVN